MLNPVCIKFEIQEAIVSFTRGGFFAFNWLTWVTTTAYLIAEIGSRNLIPISGPPTTEMRPSKLGLGHGSQANVRAVGPLGFYVLHVLPSPLDWAR